MAAARRDRVRGASRTVISMRHSAENSFPKHLAWDEFSFQIIRTAPFLWVSYDHHLSSASIIFLITTMLSSLVCNQKTHKSKMSLLTKFFSAIPLASSIHAAPLISRAAAGNTSLIKDLMSATTAVDRIKNLLADDPEFCVQFCCKYQQDRCR